MVLAAVTLPRLGRRAESLASHIAHFASRNHEQKLRTIHLSTNILYLSCITKSSKGGEVGYDGVKYLPTDTIHNQSPNRAQ